MPELIAAEKHLIKFAQEVDFMNEVVALKAGKSLPRRSSLLPLHPFIDSDGVVRVGGRECNWKLLYSQMHPIILHGKRHLTRLHDHSLGAYASAACWVHTCVLSVIAFTF